MCRPPPDGGVRSGCEFQASRGARAVPLSALAVDGRETAAGLALRGAGRSAGETPMSTHTLSHDVPATAIPAGTPVTLPAGAEVFIAQTLGGNVTVRTDRGLFHIASGDAGAIAGYTPAEAAAGAAAGVFSEQAVWDALKTCFDPEIPVNIVDLGLVYDLSVGKTAGETYAVDVKMTLTAPGCGMGPVIAEDARQKIAALPQVESARVHIVWDPQWAPQMISPEGRRKLGLE
jgi:probable FeS assembly SUF system protein SufT